MKCQEFKQNIYAYLDGCLTFQEVSELEFHLSNCPSCRGELGVARSINCLLENHCIEIEPPADFVSSVMEKVNAVQTGNTTVSRPAATVIPLAKARKEQTLSKKLANKSISFSRVASLAVLIAAASSLWFLNNIPKLAKIAGFGGITRPPIINSLEETPKVSPDPGVKEQKPEEITGTKPEPGVSPGDGGETDPAPTPPVEPVESGGTKPEQANDPPASITQPPTTETNLGGEEVIIPPRLDGLFQQVTGTTTAPAKGISLTAISAEEGFKSIKPAWAEQGKTIYYLSTQEADPGSFTLWAKDINSSSSKILARNAAESVNVSKPSDKSPDGKYKLYQENGQVFAARADGSEAKALTPELSGAHYTWAWSPDNQTVAINVKGSQNQGVWLAEVSGDSWSLVTANGGGTSLSWSPDGKKLAFTDAKNMIYVGVLDDLTKTNLLMVVPKGDNQGAMTLAWSPDSKQLLFDWAKEGSAERGIYMATLPE